METITIDILKFFYKAFAIIAPATISFIIGRNSERRAKQLRMYEQFYYPMYTVLEKYLDDPTSFSANKFEDLRSQLNNIFQNSNGSFPWDIYLTFKKIDEQSFLSFCNYFNSNFTRCRSAIKYNSYYNIPINKEKSYLRCLIVSLSVIMLSFAYLFIFGTYSLNISLVVVTIIIICFIVILKTANVIDFLLWPKTPEKTQEEEPQ